MVIEGLQGPLSPGVCAWDGMCSGVYTESFLWGCVSLAGGGLGSLRPHGSRFFGEFVIFGISAEFAVSSFE